MFKTIEVGPGSGTQKCCSRNRNKSFRIHNTAFYSIFLYVLVSGYSVGVEHGRGRSYQKVSSYSLTNTQDTE